MPMTDIVSLAQELELSKRRQYNARAMREWRKKHPEKVLEANRKHTTNVKQRAIIKVGNGRCGRCGCDDIRALELNHVRGGGHRERKLVFSNLYQAVTYGKRPIEDLNVLCRACNGVDFIERKHPDLIGRLQVVWTPSSPVK